MEDDLVAWGRVLRIETIGRRTGRTGPAAVGFVERGPARSSSRRARRDAAWGLNLLADPACRVHDRRRAAGPRSRAPLEGAGARRRGP